jgi:trk system potassium uptake protein TrkH
MWPRRRRRLSLHSKITLTIYAALIFLGTAGLLLAETQAGGTLSVEPPARRLSLAMFQAISARTAGFAGLANIEALMPASQVLIMGLMLIGSAPASMGGGITTGTLAVLLLSLWGYVQGRPAAQVGGRTIAVETVRRASAIVTVSLLVVGAATWLILLTHPVTLDRALFEVISAFATCGLTLAFTNELNLFGQVVIMLIMFWGRLGALTIVAALAHQAPAQAVTYPEEALLIG